jgi:hypothetical protein
MTPFQGAARSAFFVESGAGCPEIQGFKLLGQIESQKRYIRGILFCNSSPVIGLVQEPRGFLPSLLNLPRNGGKFSFFRGNGFEN